MKVRICYTVVVSDQERAAIAFRNGGSGLATREQVRQHYEDHGASELGEVLSEYDRHTTETGDGS